MKKQWKRLLIAALSSSSVFAVTWYWYQSSEALRNNNGNDKPLAYVGKVVEDIQRRPASRLLWQLVNTGEPLYNGEAIRTSDRGEVRIQFADSDRYLDLEPDSLIVIKKSEGEIALDLMEGSLFVNAQDANAKGTGLVLNSANGKVDLSKASASLTKGAGSSIDVQVLEGTASIQGANGQSKNLSSGSQIEILSPLPQKPITMNAESLQPVAFRWKGFPARTKVSLWLGPTRKQLKEISTADMDQAQLMATVNFGRHFWKLVGTGVDGTVIESPVFRSEVVPRYAPTVVFPTSDAEIAVERAPAQVDFKWQKGEDTRQTTLEIWSDASLKKKILSRNFTKEENFEVPDLKYGTYFWRLSSVYTDSDSPLLGKVQRFSLKSAKEIADAVAKAQAGPVKVNMDLTPAQFTQYYVEKPLLDLKWTVDNAQHVTSWKVKLREESADPTTAESIEVKDTTLSTSIKKPGRYIASVEAIGPAGQVLGTVTSQPVTVAPLPPLTAPLFSPPEGILQSSMDGRTQLQWKALEGAKEYILIISKDGKVVKRGKYQKNSTALRNLLPGEYQLELSALDTYGRPSEKGPSRTLIVPDKSGVKAPTLKKIKVN